MCDSLESRKFSLFHNDCLLFLRSAYGCYPARLSQNFTQLSVQMSLNLTLENLVAKTL